MMKTIRYIAVCLMVFIGAIAISFVSIDEQAQLLSVLLQVSTVLFAIIGVWIAVLDPTSFLEKLPDEILSPRNELALKLIPQLITTTIVFIITISMKFITPILRVQTFLLINPLFIRSAYGFILTALFLAQIWVIVGTMLPIVQVLVK